MQLIPPESADQLCGLGLTFASYRWKSEIQHKFNVLPEWSTAVLPLACVRVAVAGSQQMVTHECYGLLVLALLKAAVYRLDQES